MIALLRNQWILIVILALFVTLASVYSVVNPLFEAPDEVWHYGYVRWLAGGHGLAAAGSTGVAQWAQEGSQPPLYYLIAAGLTAPIATDNAGDAVRYNPHAVVGNADSFGNRAMMVHGPAHAWPWHGVALAAHLARLFSILLGATTVVCTYGVARGVAPGWLAAAPLAGALVAFNPQFLFISAAVSNDNLVTALCAAGLWLCVSLVGASRLPSTRRLALLGLLVGLAALSKLSGLLLAGLALGTLLLIAWRRRSWRFLLRAVLIVTVVALAVAGWWYWRNYALYGDPLGLTAMFAALPARTAPAGAAELLSLVPGVWRSFWAVFGWFNVVADEWVYWLYTALALAGVLGWLVIPPFHPRNRKIPFSRDAAILLVLWSGAVGLSLVRWAQINYPQGRLLFPAIAAAMPLLALGLLAWWPPAWHRWVAGVVAGGLLTLAAIAPFAWITPAYARPALLAASAAVPNAIDQPVGESIHLLGYTLEPAAVQPGEPIDITLYWQTTAPLTQDYSVFLHATDDAGILQAQRDSYPGLGNFPTRLWPVGAIIPDRHRLIVPRTVTAPARLRFDVGLYDHASGARLPIAAGDAFTLGDVSVLPGSTASGLPNATQINFGDKVALVGYALDRRTLQPGDTLHLTLWWEGLAPMDRDYVVFTHLVLPPDAVWAQQDAMPQGGAARTSTWSVGQRVEDHFALSLPPEAPPGDYTVAIGLYDKDSYARLPVGHSDADVVLGRVKVEARP